MRILAIETIAVEAPRRSAFRALAHIEGCEVHLLVPAAWQEQGSVAAAEPEPDPQLHLHVSRTSLGFRQHRVLFASLRDTLRDLRPDVLYVDMEPENYAAAQCRLAINAVSPGTRLALVSSRNLDYLSIGFPYRFAFTHRWCDALARRRPADIMFVRPRSTMHMLNAYARSVVHLPHPVDCALFSPDVHPTIPSGEGIFTVGYLGRLVENKGVHILIESLAQLPRNVHALIVGQGPEGSTMGDLVHRLGLESRVRFHPAVPYAEVPGMIRSMNALILPSLPASHWIEQFGRVLIESMACGVPIVASTSGEIPDVLGKGGALVVPGDTGELARAIEHLYENPAQCAAFAEAGRARAIKVYSASVVAQMLYSAFKSCL